MKKEISINLFRDIKHMNFFIYSFDIRSRYTRRVSSVEKKIRLSVISLPLSLHIRHEFALTSRNDRDMLATCACTVKTARSIFVPENERNGERLAPVWQLSRRAKCHCLCEIDRALLRSRRIRSG